MRATLERAGLECLQLFGHGNSVDVRLEQPLDELAHTKAVYICAPPASGGPGRPRPGRR